MALAPPKTDASLPSVPPSLCHSPFAAVYYVWQNAEVPGKKVNVPTWILIFGGAGIVTGLATCASGLGRVWGCMLWLCSLTDVASGALVRRWCIVCLPYQKPCLQSLRPSHALLPLAVPLSLPADGWHIMGLYGVKSVMISNSRGFCIELGTAMVVILAARFG